MLPVFLLWQLDFFPHGSGIAATPNPENVSATTHPVEMPPSQVDTAFEYTLRRIMQNVS